MDPNDLKTDVLIVGAGPVGLMAACQLVSKGIMNFIVVDKKSNGPSRESRAIATSARSMEIFQQLGILEEVMKYTIPITGIEIHSRGKTRALVNFEDHCEEETSSGATTDDGKKKKSLSQFPNMSLLEQWRIEEILINYLISHDKEILWNTDVTSLVQVVDGGVKVNVCDNYFLPVASWCDQSLEEMTTESNIFSSEEVEEESDLKKLGTQHYFIHAKYVIGCDGIHSKVRQECGIKFVGEKYTQRFFLADVQLKNLNKEGGRIIACLGDTFTLFFPLYGDNHYRIVGLVPDSMDDRLSLRFEDIMKELASLHAFDGIPLDFGEVFWFNICTCDRRMVNKFQSDRVFIAGDASHTHSPAGGQGMNTGLEDVHNLIWKMAYVLQGHASTSLLDTYEEERKPFIEWLLKFTDRAFTMTGSNQWIVKTLRQWVVLPLLGFLSGMGTGVPESLKHQLAMTLSHCWYSYKESTLSIEYHSPAIEIALAQHTKHPMLSFDRTTSSSTNSSSFDVDESALLLFPQEQQPQRRNMMLLSPGDRFPYFVEGGLQENLLCNMNGSSFYLVHVMDEDMMSSNSTTSTTTSVNTLQDICNEHCSIPIKVLASKVHPGWKQLGVGFGSSLLELREVFILVRPDQYIGFISDKMEVSILLKYFSERIHTPTMRSHSHHTTTSSGCTIHSTTASTMKENPVHATTTTTTTTNQSNMERMMAGIDGTLD